MENKRVDGWRELGGINGRVVRRVCGIPCCSGSRTGHDWNVDAATAEMTRLRVPNGDNRWNACVFGDGRAFSR